MDLTPVVYAAIEQATSRLDSSAGETVFQLAVASALGACEREVRASFAPPRLPPRRPPQSAIDELAARRLPKRLPAEGVDPCVSRPKLDILWRSPVGPVAIELKYCAKWKADTNGYQFLKDLHRLERMVQAGGHSQLAARFAAFATNQSMYWRGERPEPRPFWLTDGRRFEAGYWVQYDQKSPDTLWLSYPPFFLANAYKVTWRDLHSGWKCLLMPAHPQ